MNIFKKSLIFIIFYLRILEGEIVRR